LAVIAINPIMHFQELCAKHSNFKHILKFLLPELREQPRAAANPTNVKLRCGNGMGIRLRFCLVPRPTQDLLSISLWSSQFPPRPGQGGTRRHGEDGRRSNPLAHTLRRPQKDPPPLQNTTGFNIIGRPSSNVRARGREERERGKMLQCINLGS
jgi:hypothetical protein